MRICWDGDRCCETVAGPGHLAEWPGSGLRALLGPDPGSIPTTSVSARRGPAPLSPFGGSGVKEALLLPLFWAPGTERWGESFWLWGAGIEGGQKGGEC